MIIKNGNVLYNGAFIKTDLAISGEKISAVGEFDDKNEMIDASEMYVLPGFIDTHIHGAYGHRFSDPNPDIDAITGYEATQGVTSLAATTGSSEFGNLLRQFDVISTAIKNGTKGAKIAGIHAEGPFLNVKRKGAMIPENILTPSVEKASLLLEHAQGNLKIITIAPETENAKELTEFLVSRNVIVSLGHTDATFEQAENGVLWGATQATHTFNAMRPYSHREPGVLGCVLTNPKVKCEMICDFVHIHPKTVELIYRMKGSDNINMVSDTGHSAGLDLKEFSVDGQKRYVVDGVVRLADGTIAGSTKSVYEGVKNLANMGIPLEEVSKMASLNPAKTLGIDNETGSITVGKYADIVILDKQLNIVHTIINGKVFKN
jgi:N-acetylglucosamine-6-phosphate deacetylase